MKWATPADPVLCINGGSSSLKVALFDGERRIAEGSVDRIGHDGGTMSVRVGDAKSRRSADARAHEEALTLVLDELGKQGAAPPRAIGHRIVHGGPRHVRPTRIDDRLVEELESLVPLAPLHMPGGIASIRATMARYPAYPQVACFDTAFHAHLPAVTRRLPLPTRFEKEGIHRYGFHGLSYEYVMSTFGARVPARVVIAHLGAGASLAAVKEGRSIDTTMGLTPTGGVVMASRPGDLDPGVVVWLMRERHLSIDEVEHLVNTDAGLVALAGTGDMRTLLEREASDPDAALAVEMFAYSVRKAIGSYVAALEGIDVLVFTGGIGENAARVRELACRGLDAFGLELDPRANAAARGKATISSSRSRSAIEVVATDEDLVIARHVRSTVTS